MCCFVRGVGRMGSLQAQPTQRRKTTIVLRFPPEGPSCGDKMRSGSVGARSPILGGLETGTGGGGGESQGWTVSGREETENQDLLSVLLGSGGDFLSLFGCLDGCGDDEVSLLKALEICEKVSDGKPIFLSAAFCARPENILLGVSLQCCECPNSDCRLAKTERSGMPRKIEKDRPKKTQKQMTVATLQGQEEQKRGKAGS